MGTWFAWLITGKALRNTAGIGMAICICAGIGMAVCAQEAGKAEAGQSEGTDCYASMEADYRTQFPRYEVLVSEQEGAVPLEENCIRRDDLLGEYAYWYYLDPSITDEEVYNALMDNYLLDLSPEASADYKAYISWLKDHCTPVFELDDASVLYEDPDGNQLSTYIDYGMDDDGRMAAVVEILIAPVESWSADEAGETEMVYSPEDYNASLYSERKLTAGFKAGISRNYEVTVPEEWTFDEDYVFAILEVADGEIEVYEPDQFDGVLSEYDGKLGGRIFSVFQLCRAFSEAGSGNTGGSAALDGGTFGGAASVSGTIFETVERENLTVNGMQGFNIALEGWVLEYGMDPIIVVPTDDAGRQSYVILAFAAQDPEWVKNVISSLQETEAVQTRTANDGSGVALVGIGAPNNGGFGGNPAGTEAAGNGSGEELTSAGEASDDAGADLAGAESADDRAATASAEENTVTSGAEEQQDSAPETNTVYTDSDTILKVQQALNNAGYDCGEPDGIAGPMTNSAIQKFAADHSLTIEEGVITGALLEALHESQGRSF